MDSDYIQLWVPDRDGCMEPSDDRGYVTLEDHLAAVNDAALRVVEACAQAIATAAQPAPPVQDDRPIDEVIMDFIADLNAMPRRR